MEERIAFLEQQLAGAVTFLRQKDATEEACVARLEAQYAQGYAEHERKVQAKIKRIEAMGKRILANSNRYELLRAHMVQVWKLGIAASGENLDTVLDERLLSAEKVTHGSV